MKTIADYLQTQAIDVSPDEVAVARAAVQAVITHAKAIIEPYVWQHDKLPEYLWQQNALFEQLYLALDAAYARMPIQSAVIYGKLPESNALVRLVQVGQPVESYLMLNEENAQQHLAVRSAHSGWANLVDDTAKWLAMGELLGEHHQRNRAQISLPICAENGVVYGVLHLEDQAAFKTETIATYLGVALGVLPIVQQLLPENTPQQEQDEY